MGISNLPGVNTLLNRFANDIDDNYKYGFKIVGVSDYEIDLTYTAKSKVLKGVFEQVKKGLERRPGLKNLKDSNAGMIERFLVPEQFNNRVHTAINQNLRAVYQKLAEHDYIILDSKVLSCYFINKGDITEIQIKTGGLYAKK